MPYLIKISEEALEDSAFALEYYMHISVDLYYSFKQNFQEAIRKIQSTPLNYLNLEDGRHRRIKIKRFPYVLIYEVVNDIVIIKMVFYQKENPQKQSLRLG